MTLPHKNLSKRETDADAVASWYFQRAGEALHRRAAISQCQQRVTRGCENLNAGATQTVSGLDVAHRRIPIALLCMKLRSQRVNCRFRGGNLQCRVESLDRFPVLPHPVKNVGVRQLRLD